MIGHTWFGACSVSASSVGDDANGVDPVSPNGESTAQNRRVASWLPGSVVLDVDPLVKILSEGKDDRLDDGDMLVGREAFATRRRNRCGTDCFDSDVIGE